jgi:hypothetical protein
LREDPRYGLVTGGFLLAGIPYAIGLAVAAGANFENGTDWLAIPFVGPWLTLGRRQYGQCEQGQNTTSESLTCVGDVFVVMGLIMDGILQTGGGTMVLIGYLATKKRLVRNDWVMTISPRVIGSGYGIGASGAF